MIIQGMIGSDELHWIIVNGVNCKHDTLWELCSCYDDACCIGPKRGCQLTILGIALITLLTDGLINESVSPNYEHLNILDWRSIERVNILELMQRNLRRSHLWLIMNPGRRSYETGQYYGNFRQCSPDQCTRIISCSIVAPQPGYH